MSYKQPRHSHHHSFTRDAFYYPRYHTTNDYPPSSDAPRSTHIPSPPASHYSADSPPTRTTSKPPSPTMSDPLRPHQWGHHPEYLENPTSSAPSAALRPSTERPPQQQQAPPMAYQPHPYAAGPHHSSIPPHPHGPSDYNGHPQPSYMMAPQPAQNQNQPGQPPRQRTSIACRYCRKRKIRCSGYSNNTGGKCVNCTRMNQECVFQPVSSSGNSAAFVHISALGGAMPHNVPIYGAFGQQIPRPEDWPPAHQQTPPSNAAAPPPPPPPPHPVAPSSQPQGYPATSQPSYYNAPPHIPPMYPSGHRDPERAPEARPLEPRRTLPPLIPSRTSPNSERAPFPRVPSPHGSVGVPSRFMREDGIPELPRVQAPERNSAETMRLSNVIDSTNLDRGMLDRLRGFR